MEDLSGLNFIYLFIDWLIDLLYEYENVRPYL